MIDINLFALFNDAVNAAKMRYRPDAAMYRYGLPVFIVVLISLMLQDMLALLPVLGTSHGAIAFGLLLGLTRFLVFARVLTEVMQRFSGNRIPFLGYVLATEALRLPELLLISVPDMQLPLSLWAAWCFRVQLAGIMLLSQQKLGRVLVAYLVYILVFCAVSSLFFSLFISQGWLNTDIIAQNMQNLFNPTNSR